MGPIFAAARITAYATTPKALPKNRRLRRKR